MSTSTRTLQATRAAQRPSRTPFSKGPQASQGADRPSRQLPLFQTAADAPVPGTPGSDPAANERWKQLNALLGGGCGSFVPYVVEPDVPYVPSVPAVAGSRTSRAAAKALRQSGRAMSLEAQVLAFFQEIAPGGATDLELEAALRHRGVPFSTLRPRRIALAHRGVLVDSGETRPTPSGRRAVVWVLAAREAREPEAGR